VSRRRFPRHTTGALDVDRGTSRFLDLGGQRLHIVHRGQPGGLPLVLLPGGLSHARWWDFAAPAIATTREVFAMDPFGHGDSDWLDPPDYSFDDQLEQIRTVATELSSGPWVIGGHSQGALLSAALAARCEPWIRAVVLVDIPLRPRSPQLKRAGQRFRATTQPRFRTLEDALESFRVFPEPHRAAPEVVAHLARESVREEPDGSYTTKFDWRFFRSKAPRTSIFEGFEDLLRRIECPVLCVRGADSTILSVEEIGTLATLIAHADVVEIPNATHHPHVENPAALAEAIVHFLRRHAE
jgi:pimeloyl-ACP methyl ester carboxylesterase